MINLEEREVEKKSFFRRLIIIYFLFGSMFIFFLHSIYSLQISEFNDYEIAALENKTKEVLVQPVRGIIYDRNGAVLVNNIPSYDLIIKPWKIHNLDIFINKFFDEKGCNVNSPTNPPTPLFLMLKNIARKKTDKDIPIVTLGSVVGTILKYT